MRVLILGVGGMVGHRMWRTLSRSPYEVVGTLHRGRDEFEAYGVFDDRVIEHIDATDFDAVTALLEKIQPTVIVNCVGITKRKSEGHDLRRMFKLNTLFPHHLARWAAKVSTRVVQFSTDCVFDGADTDYDEGSVVSAQDLYGQTKFFGELHYPNCLTIRTSMIGRELAGHTELLEWFLSNRGRTVSGFMNARYSGVTTVEMATILARIISEYPTLSGIYQVAGPSITKYELLCKIRDAFSLDVQIQPESSFVCDRTLRSVRFERATGITTRTWNDMIADLAADQAFYHCQPAAN
jgi:dTDP-4-dehydrorhamnose reductase